MNKIDALLVGTPSPYPAMIIAYKQQGMPPLGLGYIATYVQKHGYVAKILDMARPDITYFDLYEILNNNEVKIVGFACTTETFNVTIRLAKMVKEQYPEVVIVLGGPHVSFEYESALQYDVIDFVVINEGELIFKELCDFVVQKKGTKHEIKGIAYSDDGRILKTAPMPYIEDLDLLPIPDRKLFDNLQSYKIPATVSTSRGCPGKCIFCAASTLSGGRYRMRSTKSIIEEFTYLKTMGFNQIYAVDDTMTADMCRLENFLEELIARKLEVTWYCESRIDSITKPILQKMKKAGAIALQFGVEAGTQGTLDSIKKNITISQIRDVFNWCKDIGIRTMTNIIIGLPSDNLMSLNETMKFAKELSDMDAILSFSICTPFPGTPLWESPHKFGVEIVCNDLDCYTTSYPVIKTQYLSAQEIRNEFCKAIYELGQNVYGRIPSRIEDIQEFAKLLPHLRVRNQ